MVVLLTCTATILLSALLTASYKYFDLADSCAGRNLFQRFPAVVGVPANNNKKELKLA
ncbi:MAG TPA: hypothetical protein VK787_06040 [Puia sp.]|jgi:hypothetical protein|nr:hypothetical protein [Puia sp.]